MLLQSIQSIHASYALIIARQYILGKLPETSTPGEGSTPGTMKRKKKNPSSINTKQINNMAQNCTPKIVHRLPLQTSSRWCVHKKMPNRTSKLKNRMAPTFPMEGLEVRSAESDTVSKPFLVSGVDMSCLIS